MQVGVSAAAAGSAYVELGKTKVMAAVHGPRDTGSGGVGPGGAAGGRLAVDWRATPWALGGGGSGGGAPSSAGREAGRELAALVAAALEPAILFDRFPKVRREEKWRGGAFWVHSAPPSHRHPHALPVTRTQSVITLAIHVLDSDGGEAAAAIAAGCLALADAGVPLADLVGAAGVAWLGGSGAPSPPALHPPSTSSTLVLDPTASEAAASTCGGTALVALMPGLDRVTQASLGGGWGPDALEAATGLAAAGAAGVVGVMREVLRGGGGGSD
jgi:ribonuclease PH